MRGSRQPPDPGASARRGSRHPPTDPGASTTVYDAGGGSGRANLAFETLYENQCSMFARTVNFLSDFEANRREQEARQITLVDTPITIRINIAREDFPNINVDVDVVFLKSAASQAWAALIKETCIKLNLDFLHSIIDRVDKSPVTRVLRLRPNGEYLARQRESSAILEVINTGLTPVEVSWPVTMAINDVKQQLAFEERAQPVLDLRIASLVSKPATRDTQRDVASLLMNATGPVATVTTIEEFHRCFKNEDAVIASVLTSPGKVKKKVVLPPRVPFSEVDKYHLEVDIVSLHRLCLETLCRFAARGRAKEVATRCFRYVRRVVEELRGEVDLVVLGLKLLSDVSKYLIEAREEVLHLVLDCVQAYAPPSAKHRPRMPARLKETEWDGEGPQMGLEASQEALARNAPPKQVHPSLTSYGDFYGHSQDKQSVEGMARLIVVGKNEGMHVHDRLGRAQHTSYNSDSDEEEESEEGEESARALEEPSVESAEGGVEGLVLVRGGARLNPARAAEARAAEAVNSALQLEAPLEGEEAVGAVEAGVVQSTAVGGVSGESGVRVKRSRFAIKVKKRGAEEGGSGVWKGTQGELGRAAPKKEEEAVIDFNKKVQYDPYRHKDKDNKGSSQDKEQEGGAIVPPGPAEVTAGTGTGAGTGGGAAAVDPAAAVAAAVARVDESREEQAAPAPRAAPEKKKKRRPRQAFIPLPIVPCVVSRGFAGKTRQNLSMLQCFATLYQMLQTNYGNRDLGFKMGIAEEVSVVVTVCQAMPRVLDYYIWIIDALYRDGFGEINLDELGLEQDDPTMVASTIHTVDEKGEKGGDDSVNGGSMEGAVYETMSEMSIPSFDRDGQLSEATPVVSIGQLQPDLFRGMNAGKTAYTAAESAKADAEAGTAMARDNNPKVPSNALRKAANQLLVSVLGMHDFESRYVNRPVDNIVLAVALVSAHHELDARERQMANKWLDTWDDGSRDYRFLKIKGKDLNGM